MGRDGGFLTPKAVAKRLKAKGLGRQWLYCQLCRKQCRDDNGFKCHCTSDQHVRKMQLYEQNPELFIDDFSNRFEAKFMEYMKRSYYSTFVPPNVVYNQIIRERNHVRMNGTRWATLHEFVEYLGKSGKVKVEETPKGLQIKYNDVDSETSFKAGLKRKRMDAEASLEDKQDREIELQIQRASAAAAASNSMKDDEEAEEEEATGTGTDGKPESTAGVLPENQPEVKVAFSFLPPKKKTNFAAASAPPAAAAANTDAAAASDQPGTSSASKGTSSAGPAENGSKDRREHWLCEGIVVKVLAKSGGYYKQKGVVKRLLDSKRVAEIQMLDSGDRVKIDEAELETVIPQIGRTVRVVKGKYRGCNAKLLSCDTAKFCVSIQISDKGPYDGRTLPGVAYEEICKLSS